MSDDTSPADTLELCLTGEFSARLGNDPPLALPEPLQRLLAFLASPPGRRHPRDVLAGLLAPRPDAPTAARELTEALGQLRAALGTGFGWVQENSEQVWLDTHADADVPRFEALADSDARERLQAAVALYRGELLAGHSVAEEAFCSWLLTERSRLEALFRATCAKLFRAQTGAGRLYDALRTGSRLLALDPVQESLHRNLMRIQLRLGRLEPALRQYEACVAALHRELGVDPAPETTDLQQEVLRRAAGGIAWPDEVRQAPSAPPAVPLVGRRRLLAHVERALDDARRGTGRLLALVGEAGIGKTRIAEFAVARCLEVGGRALLAQAGPFQRLVALDPWLHALRHAHESVRAVIDQLEPAWSEPIRSLLPDVLGPPAQPLAPDVRRDFEAIARLLSRLASARPLAVVVEDAQWADETSLRLLRFLVPRLAHRRVLLVVTLRDTGHAAPDGPGLADLGLAGLLEAVVVPPLTPEETGALTAHLLGEPAVWGTLSSEGVWRASRGNPFVAIRLIRSVRDAGFPAARGQGPAWEADAAAAWLERAGAAGPGVAAAAAVLGRDCDAARLAALSGVPLPDVDAAVEQLVAGGILEHTPDGLRFPHERLREVVYDRLEALRRRELHLAAARVLDAPTPDRDSDPAGRAPAASIGQHYLKGGDVPNGVANLRRAGAEAFARGAHVEAVTCFETALAARQAAGADASGLAESIDLRFDLRHALLPLAEFGRIGELLERAGADARRLGDEARVGRVRAYLANYHWWHGEQGPALEACADAEAIAARLGDDALRASAAFYKAPCLHALGRFEEAAAMLRALAAATREGLTAERLGTRGFTAVLSRSWLTLCLAELGEFREAAEVGREAVRLGEDLAQPFALTQAYLASGTLHLRSGQPHRALPLFERCRALAHAGGFVSVFPLADWFLGYAHALVGQLEEALELLEPLGASDADPGGRVHRSLWISWLAETYLRAGWIDSAAAQAWRALDEARAHGERGNEAWVLRLLAEVERKRRGDSSAARERYEEALRLAEELGMRPLACACSAALADLSLERGDSTLALRYQGVSNQLSRDLRTLPPGLFAPPPTRVPDDTLLLGR